MLLSSILTPNLGQQYCSILSSQTKLYIRLVDMLPVYTFHFYSFFGQSFFLLCFASFIEGVQLLCMIDKGLDACRYLQTYGKWDQAAWLAKVGTLITHGLLISLRHAMSQGLKSAFFRWQNH